MSTQLIAKIKSDKILSEISKNFSNEIYLVGGCIRDFLMDKTSYDRDLIVTDEHASEFSQKIAEFFDATYIPLDEVNKIYRVVLPDKINYLDITNPIENSLEKDLMRRDFSINAIAVNLKTFEIVDLCGGISDIANKTISMISEKNFEDDPLRILRAYRFQATLGFKLAPDTMQVICKFALLINKPAKERVNVELVKLFGGKYADETLLDMDNVWILETIFPVIKDVKKVPPNSHHHLDLLHHSVETVRQIQNIYENSYPEVQEHLNKIDFGAYPRLAYLKLAGFLHDIGKFSTWTIEGDRHRFIKHDDVGSKMVVPILKELKFSKKQIEYIASMIKNHIYPSQVMMAPEIDFTSPDCNKVMMRYIRKMGDNSIDNIILAQADRLSARGVAITDELVEKNIKRLNMLIDYYLQVKDTLKPLPILLDGNEIMKILDLKPSKKLGKILNLLHEAQLNGEVSDKSSAEEFVKNIYKNLQ